MVYKNLKVSQKDKNRVTAIKTAIEETILFNFKNADEEGVI
jgi:hypothetical protein